MKRLLTILALLFVITPFALAQDDMKDVFPGDSVKIHQKVYKSRHMLGVKYGYHISGASFTPDIKPSSIMSPVNLSVLYTYYHDLWDMFPIFGIQTGVKYSTEGFESEWGYAEKYDVLELPLISQFNYLIGGHFRIMANAGTFYSYRLRTYDPEGWDRNDIRHDYGFIFGGGIGLAFGPFELQIEGNYKRSVCSLYQPLKLSDEYWIYGYEQQIMLSAALFINLW